MDEEIKDINNEKGNTNKDRPTSDTPVDFKRRTIKFAISLIKFVESLPKNMVTEVIGKQVLRSGLSIGANFHAASRARSRADYISKMKIVEEESDETLYWLEILVASHSVPFAKVEYLYTECNELLSIIVASIKTLKKSQNKTDGQ